MTYIDKSETFYDNYQNPINWLLAELPKRKLLRTYVYPRLVQEVQQKFSNWTARAEAHEIPAIVLCVHRWQERGEPPPKLLDALEQAFNFYEVKKQELRTLAGMLLDPIQSHQIIVQCAMLVRAIDILGMTRVKAPSDMGTDMYWIFDNRLVAVEVTSRSHTTMERMQIDSGNPSASAIDPRATKDFCELWDKTIKPKLQKFSNTDPSILVVWDTNILGEVRIFVEKKSYCIFIFSQWKGLYPISSNCLYLFRAVASHTYMRFYLFQGYYAFAE